MKYISVKQKSFYAKEICVTRSARKKHTVEQLDKLARLC